MDLPAPTSDTVPGWRGEPLQATRWRPAGPCRGRVALVHGIGGHAGLFTGLATHLAARGYELHAVDLPGHGRSPGPRGWVPSWEVFRAGVRGLLQSIAPAEGPAGRPPVLLGHSLGALIALDFVLREPAGLGGLVVSSPALGTEGIAAWRLLLARALSRLWPRFALSTGIPLDACSRDPEALARLDADPLCHSRCTARLATEFLATARSVHEGIQRLSLPLLVLQGGADTVTPPGDARRLFERAGAADKTWRLYPRSYHELYDDLDREEVLADLGDWLDGHRP